MRRNSASKRGSKPADLASLRELFKDNRMWSAIGTVIAREGEEHYEFTEDGDILVDVDLGEEGTPVWCRLGGSFGGENIGMWRVPPVGAEVAVILPVGHVASDPMIVAVLSSGAVPAELDDDPETLVIVNKGAIRIKNTDGGNVEIVATNGNIIANASDTVHLGADNAADFVALAQKVNDELNVLLSAIGGTTVIANDGGASFKSTLVSALSAWPASVAASKVKAT